MDVPPAEEIKLTEDRAALEADVVKHVFFYREQVWPSLFMSECAPYSLELNSPAVVGRLVSVLSATRPLFDGHVVLRDWSASVHL